MAAAAGATDAEGRTLLAPLEDSNIDSHPAELRTAAARGEFLSAAGAGHLAPQLAAAIAAPTPAEAAALRAEAALEAACAQAAAALAGANVLLVACGAGWSADSGLPVYADVAAVPAYLSRGLDYRALCVPGWLRSDPALFMGFWGRSFNDYRDAAAHGGYGILRRWREGRFGGGRLHVLTSNVDDHFTREGFADAHHACHGTTERWQCGNPAACPGGSNGGAVGEAGEAGAAGMTGAGPVWRAPPGYRFQVHPETLLAPHGPPAASASPHDGSGALSSSPGSGEGSGASTSGAGASRHDPAAVAAAFAGNHPSCLFCAGPARPAIDMFDDGDYLHDFEEFERFHAWRMAHLLPPSARAVVLEIGCGFRVPTVRAEAEAVLAALGPRCTHVRINPDFPLPPCFADGERYRSISVMAGGLAALTRIDAALGAARARADPAGGRVAP